MNVVTQEVAYLWLIDGIEVAFTTHEDVDDTYVRTMGFERSYPGLAYPGGLSATLDLRKGMLTDTTASFDIDDIDGSLAALFGSAVAADELLTILEPSTSPATSELVWDKHIGTEKIGPAGERRRHSCIPGFNVGMHHYGAAQAAAFNIGTTPISDFPYVWPGRRCALYRLVRQDDGSWPDLNDEQIQHGARVWFGTLLGQGVHSARSWGFKCAGPESWISGNLAIGLPEAGLAARAGISIKTEENEHVLRATLGIFRIDEQEDVLVPFAGTPGSLEDMIEDDNLLVGANTYDDVVAAMSAFLVVLETDDTHGDALVDQGISGLRYATSNGDEGIQLRWDRDEDEHIDENSSNRYVLGLSIIAHEKVWGTLGYDPRKQNSERDPVDNAEQYGQFKAKPDELNANMFLGNFYSANAYGMLAFRDNVFNGDTLNLKHDEELWEPMCNNQQWRRWPPIYPKGAQVWMMKESGQTFTLNILDPMFLVGSKAFPLLSEPDDLSAPYSLGGSAVTHQGLMAFTGPYLEEGEEKAKTISQVARVCWRQHSDGSVGLASERPLLVIQEWVEPRLYGLDFDKLTGSWAALRISSDDVKGIEARPIVALEHAREGDNIARVFARLLATTGTAGEWYTDSSLTDLAYGFGGSPVLDAGVNDLQFPLWSDDHYSRATDGETFNLGVAVPKRMVAKYLDESGSLLDNMVVMSPVELYNCKVAVAESGASVRKLVTSLLAPTGYCVSLADGRFGLFDPWTFRAPGTSGIITSEDYAGQADDPSAVIPEQELRIYAPIDRLALKARRNPLNNKYADSINRKSTDPGAQYRAQTITHKIIGDHLVHQLISVVGADWLPSWIERWRIGTTFWARQHFTAAFTIPAARANEFWPGAVVSVTDEWMVNPSGSYGVAGAPGYVVSRTLDARNETCLVRCVVSADALRLYAPSAVVTRYDENEEAAGYRLMSDDDHFDHRGGVTFDVDGFIEPPWSTEGGNALIEVFQFDGNNWSGGIYGEVKTINAAPGQSWIELVGPLTGAPWWRDMWHIVVLRNAAAQTASWVSALYAPICDEDGKFDGVNKGPKWSG